MKKIAVGVLLAVLATLSVQPVKAADIVVIPASEKVLAIIDTAIDSSRVPAVIYEACFTISSSMGCLNGQTLKDSIGNYSFSEGKGSANSPLWPTTQIGNLGKIYHGYNVTKTALKGNSSIKIVFIRMAGIAKSNGMQSADPQDPFSIIRALKWVYENSNKYSIDAVSISQSWIATNALSLCSDNAAKLNVLSLTSKNIPVFAATGNDGSPDKVGFPSCISNVIGVGALGSTGTSNETKLPSTFTFLQTITNRGPGLDVVADGEILITKSNGNDDIFSATSAATPIAASVYIATNTYASFDLFKNSLRTMVGYPYISR